MKGVKKVYKSAGSAASIGIAVYKIATGEGSGWNYADIVVNGGAITLTFIVVSSPVGWAAGGAFLGDNSFRLNQSYND